ncbi:hypothetical protein CPT_Musica_060 [Burkholderia phage Musica]|uniref:Uncharacterized protein n=1 Tax=Burkholderia phage Musica TaxID=2924903 RepID=A0AAE9K4P7_9CAUD|nr:hypothetical protein CPT_Musica_060 [Burkholderia phage Musica]
MRLGPARLEALQRLGRPQGAQGSDAVKREPQRGCRADAQGIRRGRRG